MLGLRDRVSSAHQVDKWTVTSASQAEVESDILCTHSQSQTCSALLGTWGHFKISLRRQNDSNADIPGCCQLLPSCEQQQSLLTIADLWFIIIRKFWLLNKDETSTWIVGWISCTGSLTLCLCFHRKCYTRSFHQWPVWWSVTAVLYSPF